MCFLSTYIIFLTKLIFPSPSASCGMWFRIVWHTNNNISEEPAIFVFRADRTVGREWKNGAGMEKERARIEGEDGDTMFPQNVSTCLFNYMAQHTTRQQTPLWHHQILPWMLISLYYINSKNNMAGWVLLFQLISYVIYLSVSHFLPHTKYITVKDIMKFTLYSATPATSVLM